MKKLKSEEIVVNIDFTEEDQEEYILSEVITQNRTKYFYSDMIDYS